MRGEDLAHRSLGQLRQARMAGTRPVIARMRGQQTGRPQLVRVTELRRLRASQPDKPGSGLRRNRRIASRARAVVQRRQHPQFGGALQTPRHRLLAHPHRARHGIGRRLVEIGQNNAARSTRFAGSVRDREISTSARRWSASTDKAIIRRAATMAPPCHAMAASYHISHKIEHLNTTY